MPIEQILSLLTQERDKVNRAIEVLQVPKRRGRPPKNQVAIVVDNRRPAVESNGWSAAKRKAQAERMKAYWAKKRKAGKK